MLSATMVSPEESKENKHEVERISTLEKDEVELHLISISLIRQIMMDPTGVCLVQTIQAKEN